MSASNKTIGVIGCGSIGSRHMANLEELDCKVFGYDPKWDHGQDTNLHTLDRILDTSDAFVIASPTSTHHDYILRCMDYEKPIFVEKPIASTYDQWNDLRTDIDTRNLFVGYNLRFHACVKQAKQWLSEGKLGNILWAQFICAQYNDRPDYLRDGVILNWSHEIDLALHLLGPAIVVASAANFNQGQDDMADIILEHHNECITTIHLDYVTEPERRGCFIQGTEGSIQCNLPTRQISLVDRNNDVTKAWGFPETSFDTDYVDEMKAFLDHIDGKPLPQPCCTGQEALDVLEICLEVRRQAGLPA